MGTVLLTGASGFLGQAALHELLNRGEPLRVRLLVHRTDPHVPGHGRLECHRADLSQPRSLNGICDGIDAVIHLASYVGDEPARCRAVNADGTRALVEIAREAGVRRLVYVSSAATYGYAVHCGATEDEVDLAPATPVSESRVTAEREILRAGGVVLRPLFTYGHGDGRFLPAIIRALRRLPFLVNGGRARLSLIAVDDLARVIVAMLDVNEVWRRGVYHANDGRPIAFHEIAEALARWLGVRVPRLSVPYGLARWIVRLGARGAAGVGAWTPSSEHRFFLVTHDHFYDASRLWRRVPVCPGAPFGERLGEYVAWYRSFLEQPDAT